MLFRIKTITEPQGYRCDVTIEETDGSSVPTGRKWTLPFDTNKKDWAELKGRFKNEIAKDDAANATITQLTTEANDANLTTFP